MIEAAIDSKTRARPTRTSRETGGMRPEQILSTAFAIVHAS
jgi:hypothetical protein